MQTPEDTRRYRSVMSALIDLGYPPEIAEIVSASNPSDTLPYHGTQHMYTVALKCAEGADYHKLSRKDKTELFFAGLFHDFNYQSAEDDSENIRAAVIGWLQLGEPLSVFHEIDTQAVAELIRATKFPHSEARNIREKIIQDADLLQHTEPDAERFIEGLSKETGRAVTVESTQEWLSTQHFNTEWGKALAFR